MKINKKGFVCRTSSHKLQRDWYLVKPLARNTCSVSLHTLYLPESYKGKKIKLKVMVVGEYLMYSKRKVQELIREMESRQEQGELYDIDKYDLNELWIKKLKELGEKV